MNKKDIIAIIFIIGIILTIVTVMSSVMIKNIEEQRTNQTQEERINEKMEIVKKYQEKYEDFNITYATDKLNKEYKEGNITNEEYKERLRLLRQAP